MSAELIKQLSEKRQNIWSQAQGLLDAAAAESRDLTAEEEQSWHRLNGDLTSLRSRIDSVTSAMEENRAAEAALASAIGSGAERHAGEGDLEERMRAFLKGESRGLVVAAADMRDPWKRALSKGTATAGGNTVPTSFYDQLVQHMVEGSGLMQLGPTVLNTASGENLEVPVTTSHGAAGAVAEGGSIAGSSTDPAFAKRTLGAFKFGQLIKVPSELVDDSGVDLLGYIAESTGRNVGLALGAKLVVGAGTTEPLGAATSATAGKTGAAAVAGVFTADDLIDLFFSVIAPYRASRSAGWLTKDATLGAIRKLKDGADRYIFEPGLGMGAPDTILGKPVQTDPNVAAVAAAAKSVLFGDWSRYFVRLAGGVRFERSDEFAFDNDQVTFRCLIRGDGMLVDQTGAVKSFTGGAAS